MSGAIGHWGREREVPRVLFSAGAAGNVPVRIFLMLRRAGAASVGFPMAVLWLASTGMAIATPAPPAAPLLLPAPSHIRLASSGIVAIVAGARVALRGADRAQAQPIVDRFIELLATTRGLQLQAAAVADAHPAIIFEVDPRASVAADGGYRIVSGARGVRVIARSPAGLFYGSVTLWQLLTPPGWISGTAAELAAGMIDDQPRFPWRALLLDSGRHLQRVTDIEKLIDWMSLEKLNVLVWHLTDDQGWRLEIPKYPALTKAGACRQAAGLDSELTGSAGIAYCGFYTEAEVRAIVRYAAARFVSVVPEIDLPGHSQAAVAAYPWLGVTGARPPVWTDWGISPWLLKPDGRTLQFVDDVLDEAMQLFPSRYLSIGGDEADKQQWNASPELRARMQRLALTNMDQLQGWFSGQVAEHLLRHGRVPVGWDDELVAGEKLPASQVVMSWHGSDQERVALAALAQGHEVVLTPEESLYFDHYQSGLPDESPGQPPMTTLRQAYDTVVIPEGATAAQAQRVIGVQGNLWTELIPDFGLAQHALFPRMAALAELGWSRADTHDWNGFLERLTAELGRYRALGVAYADTAFAPAFDVTSVQEGKLRVALSNQVSYGEIRYTTDASVPTATSARYVAPLEFAAAAGVTLRAATYAPSGFELAAPRARVLDASTLLTHDSSELPSCSKQPAMRLGGRQPAQGPRPVYAADVGDMCWLWPRAPLRGIGHVTLTVERVAWRFGDEAQGAVVRPKAGAAGEFEIHADSCAGPLLARLPLTPVGPGDGQRELSARLSPSAPADPRDLCIFATGDPREGQWALARMEFSQ